MRTVEEVRAELADVKAIHASHANWTKTQEESQRTAILWLQWFLGDEEE